MCIIKLGKELINTEAFNESVEEKNYNYILNNCFDESIGIEKRKSLMPAIIPKIDIEFFLANSTISSIKVLPLSKGRVREFLIFCDNQGNRQDVFQIKCEHCGKWHKSNRGYMFMHRKHFLCKPCACHFAQVLGAQDKFEQTMMQRYGCRRPIQNNEIKLKTQKTMVERYGASSPLESDIVKQKIADKMMEKYGVDNPFLSNVFQLKCKKNYINHSKKSDSFMERLSKDLPFTLLYGDNEKLFTFKNHWYRVDGYIEERKFAIEFQGNYYHANPAIYGKDYIFNMWGYKKTAKEIWEKDAQRKNELESVYGIKVYYIWEKELDEQGYDFVLSKIKKELGL